MNMNESTNHTEEYKKYTKGYLARRELLEHLAEEAAEISKAALKCIRAEGLSNNTTAISAEEAYHNLEEKFSDVLMPAELLGLRPLYGLQAMKWYRCAKRLGYTEEQNETSKN